MMKKIFALTVAVGALSVALLLGGCDNNAVTTDSTTLTPNTGSTTTTVLTTECQHTEGVSVIAGKSATCTESGLTDGSKCDACGVILTEQEEIPALGHTEVVDAAVAATCTETGLTEGKHCSVCNEVLVAQEAVAAKGHTKAVDAAVEATCTATGLTEGKHCSVCNEVLVAQEAVAAKGHTEVVDAAAEATCTATGLTEGKHCSVCNEVLVAQEEIPMASHAWSEWITLKEATTEAEGEESRACTNAGCTEQQTRTIAKLTANEPNGHVWGREEVLKAATCTNTGIRKWYCTNQYCSATKEEEIPALGHTEVIDAAKEATCTATGLTEGKHCSACNEVLVAQEVVAAKGHTEVVDAAVEATCAAVGKTQGKHCSVCGEVLTAQEEIPMVAHTWGQWATTTEPTYEAAGEQSRACSVCGKTETQSVEKLKMFTEDQLGTYFYKNTVEGVDTVLTLNADGTITLKDTLVGWDAQNIKVTKDMVWDAFYNQKDGYRITFASERQEEEGTFYFEKGILYFNVTGTPCSMLKPTEGLHFTAQQTGTYSGTRYDGKCTLTVNEDATVTFTYISVDWQHGGKKTETTVENIALTQTEDGYAFICENLLLFVFVEDGQISMTEQDASYVLTRA